MPNLASSKSDQLPQMAFIVGIGRSGTTLLTNMFNSNPASVSTPENEFVLFTYESFHKKDFSDQKTVSSFLDIFNYNYNKVLSIWRPGEQLEADISELKQKDFASVCKLVYLNYSFADRNLKSVKYIIDKNPSYSLYLVHLSAIFPEAKFIVLARDFRDNVLSRKTKSEFQNSLSRLAESWNIYYEQIFHDLDRLKLDHQIVRYEDLVAQPEKVLTEICSFLNLEYSAEMLNFQELSKKIKSHVKENRPEEVYQKIDLMHSHLEEKVNNNRVKAYEKELTTEEIAYLNYTCSELGMKFGYLTSSEIAAVKPQFSWKVKNNMERLSLKAYHLLSRLYYHIPVSLRLKFLKKNK